MERKETFPKRKITILNSLALAPLIHVSCVVSTPYRVINEINDTIQNFMWDGSTTKIALTTLIQNIENGGLKLCHFETKVKAIQLSWVKRIIKLRQHLILSHHLDTKRWDCIVISVHIIFYASVTFRLHFNMSN